MIRARDTDVPLASALPPVLAPDGSTDLMPVYITAVHNMADIASDEKDKVDTPLYHH